MALAPLVRAASSLYRTAPGCEGFTHAFRNVPIALGLAAPDFYPRPKRRYIGLS